MIKYPIYVTVDTNILDAANFDFDEKSTLQLLVNYVKRVSARFRFKESVFWNNT